MHEHINKFNAYDPYSNPNLRNPLFWITATVHPHYHHSTQLNKIINSPYHQHRHYSIIALRPSSSPNAHTWNLSL